MPSIEVDIEIYCSCGEGLCNQSSTGRTNRRGQPHFTVEPCEKCLEKAESAGYEKGRASNE